MSVTHACDPRKTRMYKVCAFPGIDALPAPFFKVTDEQFFVGVHIFLPYQSSKASRRED